MPHVFPENTLGVSGACFPLFSTLDQFKCSALVPAEQQQTSIWVLTPMQIDLFNIFSWFFLNIPDDNISNPHEVLVLHPRLRFREVACFTHKISDCFHQDWFPPHLLLLILLLHPVKPDVPRPVVPQEVLQADGPRRSHLVTTNYTRYIYSPLKTNLFIPELSGCLIRCYFSFITEVDQIFHLL